MVGVCFTAVVLSAGLPASAKAPSTSLAEASLNEVYIIALSLPTTPKAIRLKPVGNGQCVAFVQANGYEDYRGNAYEWEKYINSKVPIEGGVVVLDEGYWEHVALIGPVGSSSFKVWEQNYEGKYVVSSRIIPFDYPLIKGFIIN